MDHISNQQKAQGLKTIIIISNIIRMVRGSITLHFKTININNTDSLIKI